MDNQNYSQIHLVDMATGQRLIIHIGPTVGRSESEITLQQASHPLAILSFTQANARQFDASVVVKRVERSALDAKIEIDGKPLTDIAPIGQFSIVSVNGYQYRCELYAWGRLPFSAPVNAAWLTTTGPVREQNEDAIGIYQHRRASLFAVADGVGGGEAGERVSEFTIQFLLTRFHKNLKYDVDWSTILVEAFEDINAVVRQFAYNSASPAGSTLTTVVIQEWDAHIAHIGDTRLYHYSGGKVRRLTTEHATYSKQRMENMLVDKTALQSTKRNVLIKGIGKADTIEPDVMTIRVQPGDKLIICSDGVFDFLTDADVVDAVRSMTPKEVCKHLVRLAEERFSNDNESVLFIDILDKQKYQRREEQPEPQSRVYIGYNRAWKLKLKASDETITHYQTSDRKSGLLKVTSLVAVVFIVCILLYLRITLGGQANNAGLILPQAPTLVPTLYIVNTPTRTLTPTITPSYTPSPTITPTQISFATESPPTSTLRPLPTSTFEP